MSTSATSGVEDPDRLHVQYSAMFGGWLMTCPICPSMVVRDTWSTAMNNAHRHIRLHQQAPRRQF